MILQAGARKLHGDCRSDLKCVGTLFSTVCGCSVESIVYPFPCRDILTYWYHSVLKQLNIIAIYFLTTFIKLPAKYQLYKIMS